MKSSRQQHQDFSTDPGRRLLHNPIGIRIRGDPISQQLSYGPGRTLPRGAPCVGPGGYSQKPAEVPTPGRVRLVVGLTQSPPFSMRTEDGSWTGISVDLWQWIAADLGVDGNSGDDGDWVVR